MKIDASNNSERQQGLREELERSGRIVWRCKGFSMMPLIRSGHDAVVIVKADDSIKPMDVVMYTRPGSGSQSDYVLHRVIEDAGDHYIILGDNCIGLEKVPKEDVLGVMRDLIKNGKPYDFDSLKHRAYIRLWIRPWPVRIAILKGKCRVKRCWWKSVEILSPYTPRPVKEAIKSLIMK